MDGLEDAGPAVRKARRRGEAEPAGQRGGLVGEDVAEHVLGQQHVELLRIADQLHRRVVDEHVLELDVRIVARDVGDHCSPELGRGEHVRLVHGRHLAAPRARELEGPQGDPLDLGRVVLAGVEDGPVRKGPPAPVVEAADELADDEDVDPVRQRGAQVRVHVQRAAELDEPLLRPDLLPVELRRADRAEEDRVGGTRSLERALRQRRPMLADRGAAERQRLELERERRQHALGARHHLGADPVAGKEDDLHASDVTAPRAALARTARARLRRSCPA